LSHKNINQFSTGSSEGVFESHYSPVSYKVYFALHYPTNFLGEHTNKKMWSARGCTIFFFFVTGNVERNFSHGKNRLRRTHSKPFCEVCELQLTNKISQTKNRDHERTYRPYQGASKMKCHFNDKRFKLQEMEDVL
jgi:hypothetical protein